MIFVLQPDLENYLKSTTEGRTLLVTHKNSRDCWIILEEENV